MSGVHVFGLLMLGLLLAAFVWQQVVFARWRRDWPPHLRWWSQIRRRVT